MPPQENDHDLLIELRNDVKNIKVAIEELADGKTANCAREQARINKLEADAKAIKDDIASLFEHKASKGTLVILGGIWLTLYCGILTAVIIILNK